MPITTPDPTERLVRFSRRQLWFVLIGMLLFAAAYLIDIVVPGIQIPSVIGTMITIGLILALPQTAGIDFSSKGQAMRALQNDELRQQACAKAFRNGFFVLLAYPPLCAFALTGLAVANPLPIVVETSLWLGAATCLASILWYDR